MDYYFFDKSKVSDLLLGISLACVIFVYVYFFSCKIGETKTT